MMAAQHLTATRRAAIASFAAVGLASAVPGTAQALVSPVNPRTRWEAAEVAYRRAQDELDAYERDWYNPACDRLEAARRANALLIAPTPPDELLALAHYDVVQERFDTLVMARFEAIMNLCTERAPDFAALQRKLDVMVEDRLCEANDIEELIESIREDVRRLAGRA